MSERLIDKMARAIREGMAIKNVTSEGLALAALRAIEEPTQAMLDAAWGAENYVGEEWTLMVRAAIAEAERKEG